MREEIRVSTSIERATWEKPEVRLIKAAEAESAVAPTGDGPTFS
jgi:hypothetical protein